MIYKFWRNADYLESINHVLLENGNIEEIEYSGYKKGWFNYAFNKGELINTELILPLNFTYDSRKGDVWTEILHNVYGIITISTKVKAVFEDNNIGYLQYIPIEIEDIYTGNLNTDYYVVNFLKKIDGINLEYSQYKYSEKFGTYSFWGNHICFNKEKIEGLDIFTDVKSPFSLFVSEKIKQIFNENGWEDMNFTPMDVI